MRYVIKVAYDGTSYCGWQIQKNGVTVQQTLSDAAYSAFNRKIVFTASGRTDSGVHALGQVCHADIDVDIPGEKLADALNVYLPVDVRVMASAIAPAGFDANRSAKKKTYVYHMYAAKRQNPLKDRYSVWIKGEADVKKMREAAKPFIGEHDFKAYCSSGSQVLTTTRTVYSVEVERLGEDITVSVCGSGFLYNMVRTIAGTLLYYSLCRISLDDVVRSIDTGDRRLVGKTMPARGLVLEEVDYGTELFK